MLLMMGWLGAVASAGTPSWEETLDAVKPAVVSIRMSVPRAFDTESARSSYATGFIVDAEQGIVLTNRHVVQPGPIVAEAVLENHEEVALTPIYRDPVHDFGFFRFDPNDVQFMELTELALHPEAAQLDTDVRIIGNDAGEQGAILQGTLSRLDRAAPAYGRGEYNDFNTFYIQSASSTSGGSSGSPVLDIQGRVVALNAGSKRTSASSFFLPLDRVVRALEHIQAGEAVSRGTLQTMFRHLPYDELKRRQLLSETEELFRQTFPTGTGMLVVERTVRGSSFAEVLRPGDILTAIDGQPINHFVMLESILDGSVGQEIALSIERNAQPLTVAVVVDDLHAITPSAFLEVGGAILNDLSYQKAMSYGVPLMGVSVTTANYALGNARIPSDSIIFEANGMPVGHIEELEPILAGAAHDERVLLRYYHPNNPSRVRVGAVDLERQWLSMQLCTQNPDTGLWPCTPSATAPPSPSQEPRSTTLPLPPNRIAAKVAPSMVMVSFDTPFRTDGVYGAGFQGTGAVVDAERGLVVVDRDTVPVMLGEVSLIFGGSVEVPGETVWLHPEHNITIVQYDPADIGDTPVSAIPINPEPLGEGDRIWQVGLSSDAQVVWRETVVERIRPVAMPIPRVPFFRDSNVALVDPQGVVPSMGGVLVDRRGHMRASWASFVDLSDDPDARLWGLPSALIAEGLENVDEPTWQSFGVEFAEISLVTARQQGLGDAQASVLEAHDDRRRVLQITRIRPDAPAALVLQTGDILLGIDGMPATRFREVDAARSNGRALFEVFRRDQVLGVDVGTMALSTKGTSRVVVWAGAVLQETPDWVAMQRGIVPEGVYISWYWYGSPAVRYGLRPTRRITSINGVAVSTLDELLAQIDTLNDRDAVQITTLRLDDRQEVLTLRVDDQYWPTYEVIQTEDGWRREMR